MKNNYQFLVIVAALLAAVDYLAAAPLYVENLVRIKGQETTTIRGYGIVSGLNGTGDDPKSYSPLAQAILRQFERSGMAGASEKGINATRNSALVEVTVTIPASGGRDGDRLDATVVSVGNAKSLTGGVLSSTMLAAPIPHNEKTQPLGNVWGEITIEQQSAPNVGRIKNGCRLFGDFTNPYIKDGNVTLVIKKEHTDPRTAVAIADAINNDADLNQQYSVTARAIDSHFVVVRVPQNCFGNPMEFISELMSVEVPPQSRPALPRVTINERVGVIAIDENVEVKPTLITHRNIVAEIPPQLQPGEAEQMPRQFVDVDTPLKLRQMNGENATNMKLKALQASLDAVRVTPQDMIEIIKILKAQGALVGEVVFVE
ncbi:MAG: flagellar basal body P-ring protein FlgI [Planctomycetaceae bacterium]|jgi:flagellar P-ring protein precursor FlgI|nr:flagellar basal body P-ring protein FlgI [Planctomycetaceae bacterium]